jgi:5-oxoprolinase (ATP-hydrolysing) subunit A
MAPVSRTGKRILCSIDSLCVHGEEPTTLATAAAARAALEQAGVRIVTLPEMEVAKGVAGG